MKTTGIVTNPCKSIATTRALTRDVSTYVQVYAAQGLVGDRKYGISDK